MNQDSEIINSFKNKYEMFSNFFPCVVHYEDRIYPTIEHAYVAAKSKDEIFRKKISEIPSNKVALVKHMGRKIKLRTDWEIIKIALMQRLLVQKYNHESFRNLLLSTKGKQLIEGNYWHDNFWGNCYCKKCINVSGKNMLGKLTMKIRDDLFRKEAI